MRNSAKRILSLLLSLVLVLSLVPATVFATEAETTYAAVNTTTGVTYDLVGDALDAAQAGQTIQVTKDTEDHTVLVDEDITLDLNGYQLDASYVIGYGQIIDSSEGTTGYLVVSPQRLLVRSDNLQLPVKDGEGYRFVEVIGFNATMINENKYAFQPLFEADAHEYLVSAESGVSIQVDVSWKQAGAKLHIPFEYSDAQEVAFINSYKPATGKYGKMFTLTQLSKGYYEDLGFEALVVSDTGVVFGAGITRPEIKEDDKVEVDSDNKLVGDVTVTNPQGSATIQAGTQLEDASSELKLTTSRMDKTGTDLTLDENETLDSFDIHVSGIAKNNTVPVIITLNKLAPEFLNKGNLELYHVENGETVPMTRVYTLEEVDAHNEYYYDIITGTVTVAMSSFSEVAVASDDNKAWEGGVDHSWYVGKSSPYTIANADQLWSFSQIVGGMAEGIEQDDFQGKTVKLVADINLGDKDDASTNLFYPIGYYNDAKSYTKPTDGTRTAANVTSFQGTFDGQGHTISNFYQNTWQMWGDYDGNYYKAAMGLFGYVVNGTVKNLTVDNFSSDGEYTPTGCVAAYAVNSTFENISLTNCNPRVYNTGNGGIIGIAGRESTATEALKLKNITVDNSNKISALWGSYDVACGGLVGMYRGNADGTGDTIHFENCHVSAQIDVFNDVCANYQYYAYRYSGMMIGSVRHNTTDSDGKTVPNMTGISASGCTVHFGTWNDYYYCEIVANSLASYTHDHQFSRLTQVKAINGTTITYLDDTTGTVPASGWAHYVVVDGDHASANATCYHFKDGKTWEHKDAGTETVNGVEVLKEDNQHIYLEFNNLFTGYGWGVTTKAITDYAEDQIKILDREEANSVAKFQKADTAKDTYSTETTVTVGQLFKAAAIEDEKLTIKSDKVQVFVSPVGETSTAGATYTANPDDWTKGTLTFSGTGAATITITDYYFCTPTTINVTIEDRQPVEKFDVVMNNGDFLHRVGNQGTVALNKLFTAKDSATIGTVSVNIEAVDETGANGTYTSNATWTNGTIQFTGTGVVKVTITDNDYCIPTVLYLEVVDATNVTGLPSTISGNVVLLNDCGLSSLTVSGRNTVYGNGFTATYTGNGQYLNNGLKQGVVTVSENGTLDNLRIVASVYPDAYMYYTSASIGNAVKNGPSTTEGEKTRYHYQLSAVVAKGNATIVNCYIYGGRNNIFVDTGDVTIKGTVLECGTVANVQIQSNASHTIIFEDVTTIQHRVNATIVDTSKVMLGAGIVVGPETTENPKIVLNGDFKQYNWVTADDKNAVSNDAAETIINSALKATAYNHTVNGETASNLGIIYMNEYDAEIKNSTGLPYEIGTVSINGINGKVYSLQGATADQIYSDWANADKTTENDWYQPQFKYPADLGGQLVEEGGDEHCYREGDTVYVMFPSGDTKELDLAALVDITKYTGQNLSMVITCKDGNGDAITVTDGKVSLSEAGEYTVTYTATDNLFYGTGGSEIDHDPISYSWDITVSVSLKDTAVPDARFEFDTTEQKMGYYVKSSVFSTSVYQYIPFLKGLKIYDYNGKTEYLRFDGSNDFNKVAKIEVTNKYSSNDARIEVTLTDGGVIDLQLLARADSGGSSTYTGSIKTSGNVIYFVNDGTTSEKDTTTTAAHWIVDYYKFTGNNGVAIQSAAQKFTSTGSGASTPSGSFGTTIKYTVTYDANGGNCGQNTGYATSAATAVTLPTPSRSGYIFAGWHTAASGGTRVGGAGDSYTPSANITLYAQWGKPCNVIYNANGGSCGTASEKYTGDALTLPTATRDGYWFIGWYDAAEGGNKIGDAGAKYNPTGEITLYAHWQEAISYTVTYNANGGSCGTASATYQGTALTLPTATKTGNKFLGWYTATSGGTKIGDAGATYVPSANITLYAQWSINSYKINVTTSNASVSGVTNGQTVAYGTTVSVTVSFDKNNSKTFTVKNDTTGETILNKSAAGTYTFTMPDSTVTINASSSGCFAEGTLITLADGTQKPVEHITYKDELLAWDFHTGTYAITVPSLIETHEKENCRVINLQFADGTVVRIVADHGFFDADVNEFVFIDENNVASYIGHSFVKRTADGSNETVNLVDYNVTVETVSYYTIQTAIYNNCIAENMFTLTSPPEMLDNDGWFDYFEIGDDMKYDQEKMQADIEKYGLYTYEDFAEYVTYEQFIAFNGPYLKILVGKGVVTYEEIVELIAIYVNS